MAVHAQDFALVVGLNDYPYYGGGDRSLRGAIRDAEAVARWLRDSDTGGGLPDDNIELATSRRDPLVPVQEEIDAALLRLVRRARESPDVRRLYFYFSGHGHVTGETRNDVALCLPNWSQDVRHAALSSSRYLDYLTKCTAFSEIIMLLDCCRTQRVAAMGRASTLGCAMPSNTERKIVVGYASEYLKPAFEGTLARGDGALVAGAEPAVDAEDANEVRGFFTEALLAGLRAGAARPQGGVTVRALKRYLEVEVERLSGNRQRSQIPLDMRDDEADAMILGTAVPAANVEILFRPGRIGPIDLIGPANDVLKSGSPADGPWRLRLDRGLHVLHDTATGEERPVRFTPAMEVTRVEF